MGSEVGDSAGVRNEAAGSAGGNVVQSGAIHGDVHFHNTTAGRVVVPRQLPGAARHFVNRAVEQDALTTLLNGSPGDGVVLVSTIDGTAGVGKSTLAVHWAHRMRERFPDGELYVNLRGFDPAAEPTTPADALASFLTALDIPAERIPAGLDARAALFRSLVHGKGMLVLLDNARSAEQVRPLLPGSPTCLVLVTSRNRLDDLVIREGATRISLELLTDAEARTLLTRYLGADRVEAEPDAVNALIEHCAGLPLALGIVAVRAAENPDFPVDELVSELRDERERLDALEASGETGVRAVFSWSYHSLSPDAARLFRLLGLPTGPDISLAAAADLAGLTHREARRFLGELTRAHLLHQHAPGRFQFHDLLRAYAAECAAQDETPEDREKSLRRLLDHYLQTSYGVYERAVAHARPLPIEPAPPTDSALKFDNDDQALRWWDDERANLLAAVRQACAYGFDRHLWQLSRTLMYYFKIRSYPSDWLNFYNAALSAAHRLDDRSAEGHLWAELATVHFNHKEFADAARSIDRARVLYEEVGDTYWESTACIALAEDYVILENFDDARRLLQHRLELDETHDKSLQGYGHTVFGDLHRKRRNFGEASKCLKQALFYYREAGEKYGEGFVLNNLADTYVAAGRLDDAIDTYRKAVTHRREIGHRQGEAMSLHGLGAALRESGDLEGARQSWQEALIIFDELGLEEADEVRSRLDGLRS